MSDLDRFSAEELNELHLATYRRSLACYERASEIIHRMVAMPVTSGEYEQAEADARLAMAAGEEAHEQLREISRAIDARREARHA